MPTVERKPVLLLADSMGGCISQSDQYITPVVKSSYNYDWMATDVVEDVVNLQRYKNILIWAGSHAIHQLDLDNVHADLKGLINVIQPRNSKAFIYVSTLIPKPRENHLTAPRFARYNNTIREVVSLFSKAGEKTFCLDSESVFLDEKGDIMRPIVENFHDGFHLNGNGAQKLRQFWLCNLNSV